MKIIIRFEDHHSWNFILLDVFFQGFQVLVEREWLEFGHKFADRCGNGVNCDDPNERSPVFLQWLDCVYQLYKQFPCAFQFNEAYLVIECCFNWAYCLLLGIPCKFFFYTHQEFIFHFRLRWCSIHIPTCLEPFYVTQPRRGLMENYQYRPRLCGCCFILVILSCIIICIHLAVSNR